MAVGGRYGGVTSWLGAHDQKVAGLLAASDDVPRPDEEPARPSGMRAARRLDAGEPVPADRCVPAGRQPFDLGADRLHVVTVVSAGAFAVLEETGTLAPVREVVPAAGDLDAFAAAYDWMRWQMALHLEGYRGGFPLWVWARIRRTDLVSNLRAVATPSPGSVVVTCSVPREHLLLTDYLGWHDVPNGSPSLPATCPLCGTAFCDDPARLDRWHGGWHDAWDAPVPRGDQGHRRPWWEWPAELRSELFATWEVVRQVRRRWPVQGCVERLDAAWVSSVSRSR